MRLHFKNCLFLFLVTSSLAFTACKKEEGSPAQVDPSTQQEKTSSAPAGACTYEVNPDDIKVEWIAYKFTDKTPVTGNFNTYEIKGSRSANDLKTLVEGLSIEIDAASLETSNAGRNATIREYFFQKFVPAFIIKARAANFSGDEKSGIIDFMIEMNSVSHVVPMSYKIDAENNFVADGKFNMEDFKLKEAYESISKVCKSLHTGEDGVAKTWDEVGLKVSAKYQKKCPS